MMRQYNEICYACDRPATTVEHCPPKSFFPDGQRDNLLTVPSCVEHNNDMSRDVEYARNVLTTLWGTNDSAFELLTGKVGRSLDRSPALLDTTFGSMRTVFFDGQITGGFTLDTSRLKTVFKACISALHFHDIKEKHSNWGIVMPRVLFQPETPGSHRENWNRLCVMLQNVGFFKKQTANPQVFEYCSREIDGKCIYCLFFYQSFIVYGLELPEGISPQSILDQELTVNG